MLRIAADDIHAWALRRIADECRRRGIVPVLIVADIVGVPANRDAPELRVAREAGFVVLDLLDAYGPPERHAALQVAAWDKHPNAAGHALLAEHLLAGLRRHPETLSPRSRPVAAATPSAGQTP